MPKITKSAKNHRKCQKLPKIPKITKMPKNATNHQKCPKSPKINLLECPIPALSSVLVSQKIRITSPLPVFLKHGQMDFSKASNSISHQLTLIFPENCQIFLGGSGGLGWLVGLGGWVGYLRGSRGLSARRARRTKSGPEGPPTRSRGPEGP